MMAMLNVIYMGKVSLNILLSDTFYVNKSKKVCYSITFSIIASFQMAVNCINFPFFLKFPIKKRKKFLNLRIVRLFKYNICLELCRAAYGSTKKVRLTIY